jgi:hypothetical protein
MTNIPTRLAIFGLLLCKGNGHRHLYLRGLNFQWLVDGSSLSFRGHTFMNIFLQTLYQENKCKLFTV